MSKITPQNKWYKGESMSTYNKYLHTLYKMGVDWKVTYDAYWNKHKRMWQE